MQDRTLLHALLVTQALTILAILYMLLTVGGTSGEVTAAPPAMLPDRTDSWQREMVALRMEIKRLLAGRPEKRALDRTPLAGGDKPDSIDARLSTIEKGIAALGATLGGYYGVGHLSEELKMEGQRETDWSALLGLHQEIPDHEQAARIHMFSTMPEMIRRFGKPSRIAPSPRGCRWVYNKKGFGSIILNFSGGILTNIYYNLDKDRLEAARKKKRDMEKQKKKIQELLGKRRSMPRQPGRSR